MNEGTDVTFVTFILMMEDMEPMFLKINVIFFFQLQLLINMAILNKFWTHSQVPGWTHLRVHQSVVAKSWDSEGAPNFQHYKGVEGHARNSGIRLGRGTSRSSLNLHPK